MSNVLIESNIPICEILSTFYFHRNHGWSEEEVLQIMLSLQSRGIIKSMEFNSFTRIHHEDTEIKVKKSHLKKMKKCSKNIQKSGNNQALWQGINIHFAFLIVLLGRQANANNCLKQATNNCHYYSPIL